MVSDDWDDVNISTYIDFVEKLVGIALAVVMFQHLNEMAAFNQRDDLFEADSALPDEPGVLLWIERIVPFLHIGNVMTMCASCQQEGLRTACVMVPERARGALPVERDRSRNLVVACAAGGAIMPRAATLADSRSLISFLVLVDSRWGSTSKPVADWARAEGSSIMSPRFGFFLSDASRNLP